MTEHEPGTNGVRVTNLDIYRELRDLGAIARSVKQSVDETLKPGLETARVDIAKLREYKADKAVVDKVDGEVDKLKLQVYALLAGVIAAVLGANQIGII